MNDDLLRGRVALVTGAGKRIGREVALTLGRAGADVIVHYHRSKAEAEAVAGTIQGMGVRSTAIRADVSRPKQVEAMFRAVTRRFGRLDILVNNAGVFSRGAWDSLTESDWNRMLGANLKGPFFCAQGAARLMVSPPVAAAGKGRKRLTATERPEPGGCIINISSVGGLQAWPGYIHYCASKAALIMLTRCLAKALAPRIRVNSIAPGAILFPGEERDPGLRAVVRATPLQKGGRDADIAQAVLYLATAEFVTGQVLVVDGGKSIP